MLTPIRTVAGVALVLLVGGCDVLHAPIYNLTSCPIVVNTSIAKFPHSLGSPVTVLPGHLTGVLGGGEPIKNDEIVVRDANNVEHRYDENALVALRPAGVSEDRWAYSPSGLSFLDREPSAASLAQIGAQPCTGAADVPAQALTSFRPRSVQFFRRSNMSAGR